MINPLGFGLEHFDAVGRFRDRGEGQAGRRHRDLRGPRRASRRPFTGARELADVPGRQRGGARGLRRAALPPPGQAADPGLRAPDARPTCDARSPSDGYNIRKLMVEIVATSALTGRGRTRRRDLDGRFPPLAPYLGEIDVAHDTTRREFLRDLGIGAAALPFLLNLPSLGFANQAARKKRLVVMFSPNGVDPHDLLARRGGRRSSRSRRASSRWSRSRTGR